MTVAKIAVIMSLYKNDILDYVKLSIDSILEQTYDDFDFYIQIDGEIRSDVDTYLKSINDKRLKIYYRRDNKGLAYSLNELLALIRPYDYTYIARMDADDISLPNRFHKQVEYLEMNPMVDMVGGAINEIDADGNDRGKVTKYPTDSDDCKAFFAKRNPVAHPTVLFRRSFFNKTGWAYPMDYIRNEDTRLWHEGYKNGCVIANISDVVLHFRMTDSMFENRRRGVKFAKSQLELRKQIKRDLGYGFSAELYAYATFLLMISPSYIIKLAYKILR